MAIAVLIVLLAASVLCAAYVALHGLSLRQCVEVAGKSLFAGFAAYGAATFVSQTFWHRPTPVSLFVTALLLTAVKFGTDIRAAEKPRNAAVGTAPSP